MSTLPIRCPWCQASSLYQHYHDTEWGFPVTDERRLFEKLCLEGFQAGLSWLTILNKRANFRRAFANFEAEAVARFDASDVQRLLAWHQGQRMGEVDIVDHLGCHDKKGRPRAPLCGQMERIAPPSPLLQFSATFLPPL